MDTPGPPMHERALLSRRAPGASLRALAAQPWFVLLALAAVTLVMGLRFFLLVARDAFNLLFSDQWDIYTPLFEGRGLWDLFTYQHGPHRQGLGLLLTAAVAQLSGWDTRAEVFAIGVVIALALAAALLLKRRLFGALALPDVLLPLLVLNTAQYETITVTPNPAHSALPLVLVLLSALAWLLPRPALRYALVAALSWLLVFTGFGIFMGVVNAALLSLACFWQLRQGDRRGALMAALGCGGVLAAFAAFFVGYGFVPAASCFAFPHARPVEYLPYIVLMFARLAGFSAERSLSMALGVGTILLAAVLVALAVHGRRVLRPGPASDGRSLVITALAGFTLLYVANTAVGRVCLGLLTAQSSRYTTLLIPAVLGAYFHLLTWRPRAPRALALALAVLLLLPLPLPVRADDAAESGGFRYAKQVWRQCYLQSEDVERCTRIFAIYPAPGQTQMQRKLDFLKQHRLNLFREHISP